MATKNEARQIKGIVKASEDRFLRRRTVNGHATRHPEEAEPRQEAATMLPPQMTEPEADTIRKPGESDIQAIKRHRRSELEKLTSFQSPLEEAKYIMDRIAALDFKKARLLEMCSDPAFDIVKRHI